MAAEDPLAGVPPDRLEELRLALAAMLREGVDLSVRRLRERAAAKSQHAQHVLAAYRAGRFPIDAPPPARPAPVVPPPAIAAPAARPPEASPPESLAEMVAGVDSHERALAATKEVMRAVAANELSGKVAALLLDGLREARQSIKGVAQEGNEEVEDLLPCTREAAELVRVFEGITSDERRSSVLAFAARELEADALTGPQALGAREVEA